MEYTIAVVTNKSDEFLQWERDYKIVRTGSKFNKKLDFVSNNIRYISISNETAVRGNEFNGVIIPKFVNTNTTNHVNIMDALDMCFSMK